jgi:hypothetical protein
MCKKPNHSCFKMPAQHATAATSRIMNLDHAYHREMQEVGVVMVRSPDSEVPHSSCVFEPPRKYVATDHHSTSSQCILLASSQSQRRILHQPTGGASNHQDNFYKTTDECAASGWFPSDTFMTAPTMTMTTVEEEYDCPADEEFSYLFRDYRVISEHLNCPDDEEFDSLRSVHRPWSDAIRHASPSSDHSRPSVLGSIRCTQSFGSQEFESIRSVHRPRSEALRHASPSSVHSRPSVQSSIRCTQSLGSPAYRGSPPDSSDTARSHCRSSGEQPPPPPASVTTRRRSNSQSPHLKRFNSKSPKVIRPPPPPALPPYASVATLPPYASVATSGHRALLPMSGSPTRIRRCGTMTDTSPLRTTRKKSNGNKYKTKVTVTQRSVSRPRATPEQRDKPVTSKSRNSPRPAAPVVEDASLESSRTRTSASDDDDNSDWLSNEDDSQGAWPHVEAAEFLSIAREQMSLPFTFDRHGNLSFLPCPLDEAGRKAPHEYRKKKKKKKSSRSKSKKQNQQKERFLLMELASMMQDATSSTGQDACVLGSEVCGQGNDIEFRSGKGGRRGGERDQNGDCSGTSQDVFPCCW